MGQHASQCLNRRGEENHIIRVKQKTKYEPTGPERWRAWSKWWFITYPMLTPQSSGRVASKEQMTVLMKTLKRSGDMGHPRRTPD
eukprot:15308-Chlamydomonas_euryale.AAC.3